MCLNPIDSLIEIENQWDENFLFIKIVIYCARNQFVYIRCVFCVGVMKINQYWCKCSLHGDLIKSNNEQQQQFIVSHVAINYSLNFLSLRSAKVNPEPKNSHATLHDTPRMLFRYVVITIHPHNANTKSEITNMSTAINLILQKQITTTLNTRWHHSKWKWN